MLRLALTLLVWLAPALALAEPMLTPLPDVYAKTQTVVIARMKLAEQPTGLGPAVIHVDEVVHGTSKLGKRTVGVCGGRAGVPKHQPFVAFLDEGGGMCFTASLMEAGDVRADLLQMQGFYDFNAHLVAPAMASLPQIRAALAGKPYTFAFRGKLHALDTKTGGLAPTRHEVTVRCFYELASGCTKTSVTGLDWIEGVPEPRFGLSGWDPVVHLTHRTSWPRPLAFEGRLSGWDPKRKEHTVRFEVSMPDLLTQAHLDAYLEDPEVTHGVWRYTLTFADGATWAMSDGHDYTSGPRLVTDSGARYSYSSFSFHAEERVLVFEGKDAPTLTLEGRPSAFSRAGTTRRFHHAAVLGGVTFEVTSGPREGQKGTLKLERVEWQR
jgi:hypothetical protein